MRPIDADALKQMIDFRMWDVDDDYPHDEASNRISEDHAVKKIIDEMPNIYADPVRHGKWIEEGNFTFCSQCEDIFDFRSVYPCYKRPKYCPDCGARMDKDD